MKNSSSKSIGHDIKDLSILIGRAFDKQVFTEKELKNDNSHNLTIIQSQMIHFIYAHDNHTICQCDLEKEFSRRRSTITGILKLMEKNGYITREYSKKDARVKMVTLTDKALLLHKEINSKMEIFNKNLEKGLTQEEIDMFHSIASKIKKNLE